MNKQTAHYHLPGLFEFYELYRMFLPLFREHREYFYDWCEIGSIYGAPSDCIWGGGRTSFGYSDPEDVLDLVREYGISARLTFSNSLLREEHLADERCTFTFTLNAYYSMFSGILRLHDPAFLAKMPKDLPLLFLAGDADPVGEQGKGVRRAIQSLKDAGVQNIECKLYPGARHELLVETNKQEVFADIADWLDRQLT